MDSAVVKGDELAAAVLRQTELEAELEKTRSQLRQARAQVAEIRVEVATIKRLSSRGSAASARPEDVWPASAGEPDRSGPTVSARPLNRAARRQLEREERRRSRN